MQNQNNTKGPTLAFPLIPDSVLETLLPLSATDFPSINS